MSKVNPLFTSQIRYLGGLVVEAEPLFGEMACMRNVEREEYANLEIIKLIFPNVPKLVGLINLMQRMTQIKGMAMFPRTELTDLSAKAQTLPFRKARSLGDKAQSLKEGKTLKEELTSDFGSDALTELLSEGLESEEAQ